MTRYNTCRLLAASVLLTVLVGGEARSDLVSHWPFDGDVLDAGPGGNDGTFVGGEAPAFVEGFDGTGEGAVLFDGEDDYVDVAHTSGLPISNTPAFTIALWVLGDLQSDRRVFSEGSSTDGTPLFNLGTHPDGANGAFNSFLRPGPGHRQTQAEAFDGTWHHVAWVDDGGQVDVYIDGVRDAAGLDYERVERAVDRTSIGAILRDVPCCYFAGAIDDVRIYDHALGETQVQSLIPTPGCPEEGDTHCDGLEVVESPVGGGAGRYVLSASATDDSGDAPIYTFFLTDEEGSLLQVGPQADGTTEVLLAEGVWTVTVRVDDELGCFDRADDDSCTIEVPVDPEPTCISHWPFDGDLLDAGPGQNHGTFFGGKAPAFVEGHDGTAGGAISFDGEDDYVSFAQSSALPIYSNSAYSVAAWVKGLPQPDNRVFSEGSTTNRNPLLNIGTDNTGETGKLDIFVRVGPTRVGHAKSARDAFDDTWHHVVWIDDGGQGTIWIDGVRESTMPSYEKPDFLGFETTTAGGILRDTPCCFFGGAVDDLRVYNYALSEEEITALVPESSDCAGDADTHCTGLEVMAPEGDVEGTYTLTASGLDDSGDEPLLYTFVVTDESGNETQVGPGPESSVEVDLLAGQYTVTATVDDRILCRDEAADASCTTDIEVRSEPPIRISRWTFDGDLLDSEPSANDASFVGEAEPPFIQGYDCATPGALSFDGEDDYVLVEPVEGLPLYDRSAFTVAMWVNGLPQEDNRIWSESNGSGNSNTLYNLGTDNTAATPAFDFFLRDDSGSTIVEHAKSESAVFDGTWHHVAWVDDEGDVTLYVDGVEDGTDFDYERPALTVDTTTIGGILRDAPCCLFQGAVDDVQIYNFALTAEEVSGLVGDGPQDCCPAEGDTHCDGLEVAGPAGDTEGTWTATASSTDDSGDPVSYFFTADDGEGTELTAGPQPEAEAQFELTPGQWTISVVVDDDPDCDDEAPDNTCSRDVSVQEAGVGPLVRGDVDVDGRRNITDAIIIFDFLFSGEGGPACMAAADTNTQGKLNISSGIYLLNWLFTGGPEPVPGTCSLTSEPADFELGCETPCVP